MRLLIFLFLRSQGIWEYKISRLIPPRKKIIDKIFPAFAGNKYKVYGRQKLTD